MSYISSKDVAKLGHGVESGVKTERHYAYDDVDKDKVSYANKVRDQGRPQDFRVGKSQLSVKKTEPRYREIRQKPNNVGATERLLIDENDRTSAAHGNNSLLSSHQQIMKSDDSVRFIKQKAEVNIKKQLQPKQSDRVNGLEKSRSSRNLSHSHGTFNQSNRLREPLSADKTSSNMEQPKIDTRGHP